MEVKDMIKAIKTVMTVAGIVCALEWARWIGKVEGALQATIIMKEKAEEEKAAEQARLDRINNPTTEDLLKEIRDLLKK